jgi:alcohol dehydrogenase
MRFRVNIRVVYAKGSRNIDARYNMSLAAALAMNAAVTAGMGACHVLNEELVSKAHVSHGSALAMLLPSVMGFNLLACPEKFKKIAELLGENVSGLSEYEAAAKSVQAVKSIIKDLGLPQRMSDYGINDEDIQVMTEECFKNKLMIMNFWNPRDLNEKDIASIYKAAL